MELGVAGTIGIEGIPIREYHNVSSLIDDWLQRNPDVEVVEIKIALKEVLFFYRKQ